MLEITDLVIFVRTQFLKSAIAIMIFQWNDAMKTFETKRK